MSAKLEAAARQALEALEQIATHVGQYDLPGMPNHITTLATLHRDALREALAEQATEPDWKSEATALRVNEQNLEAWLAAEPVAQVCCGQFETCTQACTPRGKFLGQREALAEQAAEQRPQNCGTGFCSCIECPYEQPANKQAAEPSDEDIERILAQTLDEVAKHYGFMHAVDVQADITRNTYLRNAFARAVLNAAPAQQPLTDEQCFRIYNDATHAASIAVFMTRIDAESYGADDKGVSGWLQEAEDRVRRRIIKTKEGGAA